MNGVRVVDDVLVGVEGRARLDAIKKVGVVAAFPELHEDVEQAHLLHATSTVDDVNILGQNLNSRDHDEETWR